MYVNECYAPASSASEREQRRIAADGSRVDRERLLRCEPRQVVRAARLWARAGQAHAAERLYAHLSADHVAIHVDVADARPSRDVPRKRIDSRVHAERQTEPRAVDACNELVDPIAAVAQHVQHGPEDLLRQRLQGIDRKHRRRYE